MILSWISLNCRRWSGRAKKCAQSDQCGQCDGRYLQAAASMCALCGEMKDKCRTLVVVAYITTTAHDRIHGKQRYRVSQLLTVPLLLTTQYTVLPPHVSATCQCQLTVAATSGHIKACRSSEDYVKKKVGKSVIGNLQMKAVTGNFTGYRLTDNR